jgi:glutaredoxin
MGLSWLWPWRRGRRADRHVVMYTRQGCHLCDAAWDELRRAQRRHGFRLEGVDVDADPELAARYGTCVPVVTVDGKVRFRGVVNPVLLRRLLR